MTTFKTTERSLSQIPALQLLANLGWQILSPQEAMALRGGKTSNVLLEGVLQAQLPQQNRIHYRGDDYDFSAANIQEAIQKLKNVRNDGLLKTNAAVYDLITLGTNLEQTVAGNTRSFTLNYIDWQTPANNKLHAVPEYAAQRTPSAATATTAKPDIVLFINGIPVVVIECKASTVEIAQAVSQNIRNQAQDYIPKLFAYVQLVMGVNKNAAKYATVGTEEKFWGVWQELETTDDELALLVNKPLDEAAKTALFADGFAQERAFFDASENAGRIVTEQDRALHSLCRPERLLELIYRFTLFDAGVKKIARYQQFFVVRATMARIKQQDAQGNRRSGIIWQTQGSGKSLTMVMLTRALILNSEINNPRIILVTDREDLDTQLGNTFAACHLSKERATSGRNLLQHLKNKVGIITTLIHKFDRACDAGKFVDESPDIFVLIDESHRTNFGLLAARMRQIMPNACYLGFTGTPLLQTEKDSFRRFGDLIEPHYSIRQAVKDQAVLPLLYEGRHVEMEQNQAAIDLWFERHTADLTSAQQADLKRKYARAAQLNNAEQVVYMRAFDISEHYRAHWQGTGFKAQLVAPTKAVALKYHKHLKDLGFVSSEVIISAPDTREGHQKVGEGPSEAVGEFWAKMMQHHGTEKQYTEDIISGFKNGDDPEILIVVDKLLTGFDAPRNTVMYLCRPLREHTLLQAIARVNRLYKDKDFGYIVDYASTLQELDKALTMYDVFAGFDEADLAETLTAIKTEVQLLPQRYSDLWAVFREVEDKHDVEAFEVLLADDKVREDFYAHLTQYDKTLAIALSSEAFMRETEEAEIQRYKGDLKRFKNLRAAVKLRYAESIDYGNYEAKIKKLLDTYIQAHEVTQLYDPVNILDEQSFEAVKQGQGVRAGKTVAAKADSIAYATKKAIKEKMAEDPAFYAKFSKLIQAAIDDFKANRIAPDDYLRQVSDLGEQVLKKRHQDVPDSIRDNGEACAYYGMAKNYFAEQDLPIAEALIAAMAMHFQRLFDEERVVDFWHKIEAQNKVNLRMSDYFYDVLGKKHEVKLQQKQMDEIINKTMQIAKSRGRQ